MSVQEQAAVRAPGGRAARSRPRALRRVLVIGAALALAWTTRPFWTALLADPPPPPPTTAPALLGDAPPDTWAGHVDAVNSVALSLDGALAASGSDDQTVDLVETRGGLLRRTLRGPEHPVLAVAFAPDGGLVAAACGEMIWGKRGGVHVFDVAGGERVVLLEQPTSASASVAWSPDGGRLAVGTGCAIGSCETVVHLWDTASWEHAATLEGAGGAIGGLAFAPDGARLAGASADGRLHVWDVASGETALDLEGGGEPLICAAWSADGTRLAAGGGHPISGEGNEVRVWEAATGAPLLVLTGHGSTVFGVAFSPDDALLASVSGAAIPIAGGLRPPDPSLRLWDARTGESLAHAVVAPRDGGVLEGLWSVAFTPDGTRVLAGSDDGRVLVWTLAREAHASGPAGEDVAPR